LDVISITDTHFDDRKNIRKESGGWAVHNIWERRRRGATGLRVFGRNMRRYYDFTGFDKRENSWAYYQLVTSCEIGAGGQKVRPTYRLDEGNVMAKPTDTTVLARSD